jgi:hypothetical protein
MASWATVEPFADGQKTIYRIHQRIPPRKAYLVFRLDGGTDTAWCDPKHSVACVAMVPYCLMAQVASLFEAGKLRATGDKQVEALDGGSRDLPAILKSRGGWISGFLPIDMCPSSESLMVGAHS